MPIHTSENWDDLPYQHTIYARSGWEIPLPVEQAPKRNPAMMQNRAQEWLSRYAMKLRSTNAYPYNCVGMIFSSRRTVIDIDHIYKLLSEDGYIEINLQQVICGDVIVYENQRLPTHIGLIVAVHSFHPKSIPQPVDDLEILSKWGLDPEFIHFYRNVPETFGIPKRYFTDRPERDMTNEPRITVARS